VGTRILTLQEDLIRAREDLRFQATHDVLTGIWNRRAILGLLHREIERAARFHASTGVLMLDLDQFKKINDTYGHLTGDAVLKETAQRITQVVRSYDFVGRYGGEEFLVLLPGCDKEQAEQSGERIRLAVTATPLIVGESGISVTISIGATATIDAPETEVLAIADAALYQAKSAGRNRTVAS
jgi:two-component system, cell cycle response regulator